jgi:nitric oxide reductase subunit B
MEVTMNFKRLWIIFPLVIVCSFGVLGFFGREIYRKAPPIPDRVLTESGRVLFTGQDIRDGQNVWQSAGGHELGTVWGHGSYVAPDWSADWLHREAVALLDRWARAEHAGGFDTLEPETQAALRSRLQLQLRRNSYDPATGDLLVSDDRAAAIAANADYFEGLFGEDPAMADDREAYAMRNGTVAGEQRLRQLSAFFFWASWACVTERPDDDVTYTNNWPPDELVGNRPAPSLILWTGFSVILLIAGIALLAWYYAVHREEDRDPALLPADDPLLTLKPTPSMRATLKYFWVVTALIVVQVILGVITAHFGIEGSGFYGLDLSNILPYSLSRTWHVQLAIFWIATSWLATGLFIGPAVSGEEPRFQQRDERPVRRAAGRRRRIADWPVVWHHAAAGPGR